MREEIIEACLARDDLRGLQGKLKHGLDRAPVIYEKAPRQSMEAQSHQSPGAWGQDGPPTTYLHSVDLPIARQYPYGFQKQERKPVNICPLKDANGISFELVLGLPTNFICLLLVGTH